MSRIIQILMYSLSVNSYWLFYNVYPYDYTREFSRVQNIKPDYDALNTVDKNSKGLFRVSLQLEINNKKHSDSMN